MHQTVPRTLFLERLNPKLNEWEVVHQMEVTPHTPEGHHFCHYALRCYMWRWESNYVPFFNSRWRIVSDVWRARREC